MSTSKPEEKAPVLLMCVKLSMVKRVLLVANWVTDVRHYLRVTLAKLTKFDPETAGYFPTMRMI